MKMRMTSLGLPAALFAALLVGGCSNTARGVKEDTAINAERAKEASAEAGDAAKDGMHRAGEAIADGAHKTADAVDGAQQTMEIKAALIADDSVDSSGIDVDTDGTAKVVTLKGHVPTAAQKFSAERIAKRKAPDYTIVNDLTVG